MTQGRSFGLKHDFDPQLCAEHLSALVQCPTRSFEDERKMDFDAFQQLHRHLEELFPLVHQTLEKEVVGRAALLYRWKGSGASPHLPLLLMAHQDVVPEGDHADWRYPPFSGAIAEGRVWGRGSSDCKSKLLAQMEAIEWLISQGYRPEYDLYLAYGYNEELCGGSQPSARLLADRFQSLGLRFSGIIDEGGGLQSGRGNGVDRDVCVIALGEKGFAHIDLICEDLGGHASRPRKNGPFVKLAQAILAIEQNPMPYRITDIVRQRFRTLAPYMTDRTLAALLSDVDANWEQLLPIIDADPNLAALFHTTIAVTMAQGSPMINMLPNRVSLSLNAHLLPGDTLEDLQKHLESIVPEGIQVRISGKTASPISRSDSPLARLIYELRREDSPECILLNDLFLPASDASYMYGLSDCVYRFSPFLPKDPPGNAHGINESMGISSLATGPDFYVRLITRYGDMK